MIKNRIFAVMLAMVMAVSMFAATAVVAGAVGEDELADQGAEVTYVEDAANLTEAEIAEDTQADVETIAEETQPEATEETPAETAIETQPATQDSTAAPTQAPTQEPTQAKNAKNNPKTGDDIWMYVGIGVAAAAVVILIIVAVVKKKKSK